MLVVVITLAEVAKEVMFSPDQPIGTIEDGVVAGVERHLVYRQYSRDDKEDPVVRKVNAGTASGRA